MPQYHLTRSRSSVEALSPQHALLISYLIWMPLGSLIAYLLARSFENELKFIWYCFFRRIGEVNHEERLNRVCDQLVPFAISLNWIAVL
jgi:hypothetical protein